MLLASADLGTNTFRLLIADYADGCIDILVRKSIIVGLGKGFDTSNNIISSISINNALNAIYQFSYILSNYKIEHIRLVGTSVLREASNSEKFIIPAQSITGYHIDIISGEEEAELTVLGVLNSVHDTGGNKLVVDIGGGSTEFVFVDSGNDIEYLLSSDIGVVKYADQYELSCKLKDDVFLRISDDISLRIHKIFDQMDFKHLNDFEIIVTAGTPTTLAAIDMRLKEYDHTLVNNYVLSKVNIKSILNKLIKLDSKERIKIPGMYVGRETLIIPGSLIILCLMDLFDRTKIVVSDGGLLEGIAYDLIESVKANSY